MGWRINPRWIRDHQKLIDEGKPIDEIISHNPAAKWLVQALAKKGRPVKVVSLGAGVKRILTVEVCSKCKGTGAE